MFNQYKVDTNKQHFAQPGIISFASPSITPSNNFKSQYNFILTIFCRTFNQTKDVNNSIIQGRKIDSPQLRVTSKEERPQTSSQIVSSINFKREEYLPIYNQTNNFNQTNKEIQKKQFDFNLKTQKGHGTIQYDDKEKQYVKKHKSSKSTVHQCKQYLFQQSVEKKRQQSQSVPRHQPSASIVNTQGQPLINLHIQNAKQAQIAKSIATKKKYDSNKYQSVPMNGESHLQQNRRSKSKSKYESKNHSNKALQKSLKKPSNQVLNQSNFHQKYNDFAFSFDNKENQSMNQNEFSPSRIFGNKGGNNNFLDSDSSKSSPQIAPEQAIANQLGKSYFLDKSALLKHLSPDRQNRSGSQKIPHQHHHHGVQPVNLQFHQPVISDREREKSSEALKERSQLTTIHQQNPAQDTSKLNESNNFGKYKRSGTANSNKIHLKGIDQIMKENLKKIKTKLDEETSKRFFEEYKQKQKKVDLSQRNQEVRKINASKIVYNHKHKNSQAPNMLNIQRMMYKKQRSKSCMNKTDSIFGGLPKSKERIQQQQQQLQQQQNPHENTAKQEKKEKKREKSFVLEVKELNKQINEEIRREILAGKLDVPTATHKKTNLTTINAKKETHNPKKDFLNMSAFDGRIKNNHSKVDIAQPFEKKRKSKSKEKKIKTINLKIKKYMERQKKIQIAAKSLEQTIENEKQLKIQKNLQQLNQRAQVHIKHQRHQSHNLNSKKYGLNKELNVSEHQLQAMQMVQTKLKPRFEKKKKNKEGKSQIFNFQGDTIFDNELPNHEQTPIRDNYNNNDVSHDFIADSQRIIYSIDKHQKRQGDKNKQSISVDISPNTQKQRKSSSKKRKSKSKNKKSKKSLIDRSYPDDRKSETQQQTAIKRELISLVNPNNIPSLIPPQSDITTIDKNQDKATYKESTEQKSAHLKKNSNSGGKSPNTVDMKKRMRALMQAYGPNIQMQSNAKISDTKLLIKLHSAAITIQQNFRKHLEEIGFYDSDQDSKSDPYINSDQEDKYDHFIDSTEKQPLQQLIAQTSPLRVKQLHPIHYQNSEEESKESAENNKFYSHNSSDNEKVIICSVISSARPEGEQSLSNTQKYIPLRQKVLPQSKQPPQMQQQQYQHPSSTSSMNSGFNTAIKTNIPLIQSKVQDYQFHQQEASSSSQRKTLIPSLDFNRLTAQPIAKQEQQHTEESKRDSQRSIFDQHANKFDDFRASHHIGNFKPTDYPELIKMRKDAIKQREHAESTLLHSMYKQKQLTPRTYEQRRKELETWVTKEKEEVKKTKKVFKEQWMKTKQIIEQTQKNQEILNSYIPGDHKHRNYDNIESQQSNLLSSNRVKSSRRESDLLKMINQNLTEEQVKKDNEAQKEKERLEKQKQEEEEERRQKEIEQQRYKQELLRKQEEEARKQREQKIEEERKQKLVEDQKKKDEENRQRLLKEQQEQERKEKERREKELKEQRDREQREKELKEKQLKEQRDREIKEKEQREREQREREQREKEQREKEKREKELREKELRDKELRDKELRDKEIREKEQREKEKRERELREKEEREQEQRELREKQIKEKERRDQLERERIENERKLKEKQEADQREKEEQDRLKRIQEEEERQRQLQKQKEEEEERKRQELERKQKEEQEKLEKQKAEEQKRIEKEKQRKEQEEKDRIYHEKMAKMQEKFANKQKEQQNLISLAREHSDLDSEPEFEDKFSHNKPSDPSKVKEVLESLVSDTSSGRKLVDLIDKPTIQPQLNRKDDSQKLLNRTRSSQDLQESKNDDENLNRDLVDYNNLNQRSIDEGDQSNSAFKSDDISAIRTDNFFTNKFDDQQAIDLMQDVKNQTLNRDSLNKIIKDERSDDDKSPDSEVLEDKKNEILIDDGEDENIFGKINKKPTENSKFTHQNYKDLIPSEFQGQPVSPNSAINQDRVFIETGSQSLGDTGNEELIKTNIQDAQKDNIEEAKTRDQTMEIAKKEEQKEQTANVIADDIFKMLMSAMSVELDLLLINMQSQNRQATGFSDSGRFLIFERRGIKTDLFAIERYVEEVLEEVQKERPKFISNIQQPIQKNSREVLNQLQNSEIGSYEHFEMTYPPVLPLELYLKLEKRRKEQRESRDRDISSSENVDRGLVGECEHIHNKVLFDCINDSLLQFKPYGKDGAPLPWSRQNRRLKPLEDFTLEEMFEIVKHDLFRWAIMQAGTLPRREFVFGGVFDDELFAEIREKKLATLLAREMIENEPKWLNYEFEEAQVKIDIGDMILEQLVTETITILNEKIGSR